MAEVTVLMCNYNGRRFLREAAESVLSENASVELFVLDDGSTDDSLSVIRDLPVRVWRSEVNQGIAKTLNEGVRRTVTEYIAILDSDDLLVKSGLRKRLDFLKTRPESLAVIGRPGRVIDEQGRLIPEATHVLTPGFQIPKALTPSFFSTGGKYPCLVWLFFFRREAFERAGCFDESLKAASDFDFVMRLVREGDIPVLFEPVVDRRLHLGNVSHTIGRGTRILEKTTALEVIEVGRRYGMEITEPLYLWEYGYRAVP